MPAHISFLYAFVKAHKTMPVFSPVWEPSLRDKGTEARHGIFDDFSDDNSVSSWKKTNHFTKGNFNNMKHRLMHLKKVKVKSDREPLVTRSPDSLRATMDWDTIDIVDEQQCTSSDSSG